MPKLLDVIVIGAGPAGLTAATYLARANMSVVVFKDKEGSNLLKVPFIGNWFAAPKGVSGPELLKQGELQARKYKVAIKQEEVVKCRDLSLDGKVKEGGAHFEVTTQKGVYQSKAVIIAVGMQIKSAGITNEFKLIGKGVAVCVSCDGPFFKNKKVTVVGSGNLAASEALDLLTYTKQVVINLNGAKSRIAPEMKSKLVKAKVPIIDKKIAAAIGDKWLTEIEFMEGGREKMAGLFLATGTASATDFAKSMGLLMRGNALEVDADRKTSVEGVWAAGDVVGPPRQIGKSVGDGVQAAINIIESMRGGAYVDHRED